MTDSMQSKGGKARAKSLTAEERSGIARDAAAARWGIAKATHQGKLSISGYEINCAVLEDGTRVLSERSIAHALGLRGSGSYWKKRKQGGEFFPEYFSVRYLQEHISDELTIKLRKPIRYLSVSKKESSGLEAGILQEICDFWLDLRERGGLRPQHSEIASKALVLMRGFAKVGIVALVDEATGYQEVRDREALQKILDKYLTDEWAKWTKTFPDDFYRELFRLKKLTYPPVNSSKPSYVGHWTNNIVYKRLAPGVLSALREKNPRVSGKSHRKRKHHQHLTQDFGHPELKTHLMKVIFLMKACEDWNEFESKLNRAARKYGNNIDPDQLDMNL